MSRMQALLLALEISAFVWIGMFVAGKWIVEQSGADFEITSAVK